jgi:hypothetical protein
VTLNKGGLNTALTCTISAAAILGSDAVHTVSVAAGDRINIQVDPASTPSSTHFMWAVAIGP